LFRGWGNLSKAIVVVGILVVIAIVLGVGWLSTNSKVSSLEQDKRELQENCDQLSDERDILQGQVNQLSTEKDMLQGEIENHQEFLVLCLKGYEKLGTAWKNEGAAEEDYDEASYWYDEGFYLLTEEYAGYAMAYYGYASQNYRDAKALFEQAKNCTPTDTCYELVVAYVGLTESGAKIMDYMYEASEYFASAAGHYAKGEYAAGDADIETMNERISSHDAEVPIYNDYLAEIRSILEIL
jgi:regulator of replication initiation timing